MDQQILDLASQNKWAAIAALIIGLATRLLKEDGPIPINIPAKYRPWLVVSLGVVSGILDAGARGTPWKSAIIGGLFSALAAMAGHDLLVESLRGGRELGESKTSFTKRSIPPPAN